MTPESPLLESAVLERPVLEGSAPKRLPVLGVVLCGVLGFGAAAAGGQELQWSRSADGVFSLENEGPRVVRSRGQVSGTLRQRSPFDGLIAHHARRTGLEERLVRSVIQVESAWNPRARSNKGALGLMQLMPATARELGVNRVFDAEENIRGGTDYLRQMLDRFNGNLELALASYNAGPGAVSRYGRVPPYPETERYIDKVMHLYRGRTTVAASTAGSSPAAQPAAKAVTRPFVIRRSVDDTLVLVTPD